MQIRKQTIAQKYPGKPQIWIKTREASKEQVRDKTDSIKEFVAYAKDQGSKGADKYYMIISKMQAKLLMNAFVPKSRHLSARDHADMFSLSALHMSDKIVSIAIKEGIGASLPYKQIYELIKKRVEEFAMNVGKLERPPLYVQMELFDLRREA